MLAQTPLQMSILRSIRTVSFAFIILTLNSLDKLLSEPSTITKIKIDESRAVEAVSEKWFIRIGEPTTTY